MKLFFKKLKSVKGFSFIELVVSVAIFSVLVISSTEIFKLVIDGQRNSISAQNVQENIRYAMERMTKEMRMAQISNTDCYAGATNKVFNTSPDGQELYFKNQNGDCVHYVLDIGSIFVEMSYDENYMYEPLTSFAQPEYNIPGIIINNLQFYVKDDPIGSLKSSQPYVTMMMDAKAFGQAMHEQKMKIQMTVSSRDYGGSGGSVPSCTPECSGAACGDDDSCGGLCDGSCVTGSCVAGSCVMVDACSASTVCGDSCSYNGDTYTTVTNGAQCWLAESLSTTKKPDGTDISSLAYCNPLGCDAPWGRLYDWNTAMNGLSAATGCMNPVTKENMIQGICPDGWHIPTDYEGCAGDDFPALISSLGGSSIAGGAMKINDTTYWDSPNTGASNSSNFSAAGAGYRSWNSSFNNRSQYGIFWSSSEADATHAWTETLSYNFEDIFRDYSDYGGKDNAYSVRCIKD
ncbi:MAG: FISUMP domain-containing protein [Patescibacteria group bacterium]|jgi:uncharacterized protein (TIGR02145 family)/prepilin-type N-terminal cleavage/methylation domain-containing protein